MTSSSSIAVPASTNADLPAKRVESSEERPPRDIRFWLIFFSLCVCGFVAALELARLNVDGAPHYSTALMPLSGGLAQVLKEDMLWSLLLFGAGSALCGAAKNMNVLIAGRTIQGLGGGGIISLTQIVVADLVSLRERGCIQWSDIHIVVYWLRNRTRRWRRACRCWPVEMAVLWVLFLHFAWATSLSLIDLNIPICGAAALLVVLFLRLRTPAGTLREKLGRIDYTFLGGSANILVPLILGLTGLCVFVAFEIRFAKHAMVPLDVLSTRTGLSGYAQNFFTSLIMITLIYYLQVYFQACYNVSSIGAGVDGLGLAFISAPMGLVAGILIQKTNSYRIPIWVGWFCMIIGVGLLSTLDADTPRGKPIGYSIISGCGIGILFVASYFPVLAPLHVSKNAQALAFFVFLRNFSLVRSKILPSGLECLLIWKKKIQVWGITIGGTILQNELHKRLPAEFIAQFPGGTEIAYSIIPVIRTLEEPLRGQVRDAFAQSLKVVWWATTGIAGLGFLLSLPMKHHQLHTAVDREWGLEISDGSEPEKEV
ncbi:Iron permease [Mycena venus]|uniref:Iron permease n=1 Tax=Mycena venus TaxID=2733690 RepID=A0A8H7D5U2_9AGAR|nr:Iron permease [Mycena venus]